METEAEFSITTSLKLAFCIIRMTLQAGSSSLLCRRCNGPRVISLGSGRRVSNLIQSNCQSQRKSFVFLPDNGSKNILTRKNLEVLVQVSMELIFQSGPITRTTCAIEEFSPKMAAEGVCFTAGLNHSSKH